jgi:hypothetical protein
MKYIISHTFEIGAADFWGRLFFEPEYNLALFSEHLGFAEYQCLELAHERDGQIKRSVRVVPRVNMPAVIQKLFGDGAGYVETGRYDPSSGHFVASVVPNVAADKISTRLDVWLEPRSERCVERYVEIENTVSIFGVGKAIESALAKQTREVYERIAQFTAAWIARGAAPAS